MSLGVCLDFFAFYSLNLRFWFVGCPFCRYEIKGIEHVVIDPFPSKRKTKKPAIESLPKVQSDDEDKEASCLQF